MKVIYTLVAIAVVLVFGCGEKSNPVDTGLGVVDLNFTQGLPIGGGRCQSFADAGGYWFALFGGAPYRSTNLGASWEKLAGLKDFLICPTLTNSVIAAGSSGLRIMRSGTTTWTNLSCPISIREFSTKIKTFADSSIFVVNGLASCYSKNDGKDWKILPLPVDGNAIYDASLNSAGELIATGSFGLSKTTNFGITWTNIQPNVALLSTNIMTAGNTLYLHDETSRNLYRSNDGGFNFTQLATPAGSPFVFKLVQLQDGSLISCGKLSRGIRGIWQSKDQGSTWTRILDRSAQELSVTGGKLIVCTTTEDSINSQGIYVYNGTTWHRYGPAFGEATDYDEFSETSSITLADGDLLGSAGNEILRTSNYVDRSFHLASGAVIVTGENIIVRYENSIPAFQALNSFGMTESGYSAWKVQAIAELTADTLLAGVYRFKTTSGERQTAFHRSIDGGKSWTAFGASGPAALSGGVFTLCSDEVGKLYARLNDGATSVQSVDGGKIWTIIPANTDYPISRINSTMIGLRGSLVVVKRSASELWRPIATTSQAGTSLTAGKVFKLVSEKRVAVIVNGLVYTADLK